MIKLKIPKKKDANFIKNFRDIILFLLIEVA